MGRRPTAAALGTAAAIAAFQVVGSFGAAANQSERRAVDGLALLLVLLGPVALAFRERWPLLAPAVAASAADVYVAAGYPYGPIFVSVVVGLYMAVQAGRRHEAWAIAAAGYTGFVVASVVDPRSADGPGPLHLALVAGWLVVVLAVSEVARARREQAAQRERTVFEDRQRRIGEQRLHLAQELHDVLAHDISLINVQASVALHLMDDDPDQARPALTNIKEASRDALHHLRSALDVLRRGEEVPLAPAPRLADIDALVDGVRAGGLDVRLDHAQPATPLPLDVELAIYRIVQEALTNVTRHAGAGTVTVHIDYGDPVTVQVTDDGVGGTGGAGVHVEPGNGIVGMRERAAALGGTVDAGPLPGGGGFRVTARFPGRQS